MTSIPSFKAYQYVDESKKEEAKKFVYVIFYYFLNNLYFSLIFKYIFFLLKNDNINNNAIDGHNKICLTNGKLRMKMQ